MNTIQGPVNTFRVLMLKALSRSLSLTLMLYKWGDRNKRREIIFLIFTLAKLRLKDKLTNTLFCAFLIREKMPLKAFCSSFTQY